MPTSDDRSPAIAPPKDKIGFPSALDSDSSAQVTATPQRKEESFTKQAADLLAKFTAKPDSEGTEGFSVVGSASLNRVVKVRLTSFGGLAIDSAAILAQAIAKENAHGWKVVQVLPDDKSDALLADQILRLITLGLYKKQHGYILILGK